MTPDLFTRCFRRTIRQVRIRGIAMREFIVRAQRNAALADWPAVVAAIAGPILIALTPPLRGMVAEFLPPGPERVLMAAIICASGAEIARCHVRKFRLGRKLRLVEAEVEALRPKQESNTRDVAANAC
jgi:hypothetical protein